jgi:hypothetical protein
MRRARYYDDGVPKPRKVGCCQMAPASLDNLKSFNAELKSGLWTKRCATIQDPKGNLMSVTSIGHIHHPLNLSHAPDAPETIAEKIYQTALRTSMEKPITIVVVQPVTIVLVEKLRRPFP